MPGGEAGWGEPLYMELESESRGHPVWKTIESLASIDTHTRRGRETFNQINNDHALMHLPPQLDLANEEQTLATWVEILCDV